MALFAVLFFRLWYLQVLSGDEYLAEAKDNRTREYKILAPRGDILDRDGNVLVDNRTGLALQVNTGEAARADPAEERAELPRLGRARRICAAEGAADDRRRAKSRRRRAGDAAPDVDYDLVYYLQSARTASPASRVAAGLRPRLPERHLGRPPGRLRRRDHAEQLKEPPTTGLEPGDEIGAGGVEYSTTIYLRGRTGVTRSRSTPRPADRATSSLRAADPRRQPEADARQKVQQAGESALASRGLPGAFVDDERQGRLDPRHGLLPDLRPDASTPTDDPGPVNALNRDAERRR